MSTRRPVAVLATAASMMLVLAACGGGDSDAELGSAENPVQLGVVGAGDPYWVTYEEAVEAEGIELDIVDFGEYNQPNPALVEGELDINQFQHIFFLANYNAQAGEDLTPIGATAIYPLGLYSTQYETVEDIPDGAQVAVPDDNTNQARGLLILQQAGLITLTDGGTAFSTVADVDDGASRVEVLALDAAVTATSLPDLAAAIVNNDYLENAALTPGDAIAVDDPSDPTAFPYINVFAATAENADEEVLTRLVEIYQNDQAVLDGVLEASGGTAVLTDTPPADLQEALQQVQAEIQAQ